MFIFIGRKLVKPYTFEEKRSSFCHVSQSLCSVYTDTIMLVLGIIYHLLI